MENNKLTIPVAIIVAGALIGGALVYTSRAPANAPASQTASTTPKTANIKPVTSADHILGNPDAKVVAVEYSDTACMFCKPFATTLGKLIDTYGKDSTVAWVYRQYPIAQLHPQAPKEAEATECVNQIAGNDVFWKYITKLYAVTPSDKREALDPAQLPLLAADFGVDKKAFQACLDGGTFTKKIQSDINDAVVAGAHGTPYTVLVPKKQLSDTVVKQINDMFNAAALQYQVTPDQLGYVTTDKKVVLNGNLPYEMIQQIVAAMIS